MNSLRVRSMGFMVLHRRFLWDCMTGMLEQSQTHNRRSIQPRLNMEMLETRCFWSLVSNTPTAKHSARSTPITKSRSSSAEPTRYSSWSFPMYPLLTSWTASRSLLSLPDFSFSKLDSSSAAKYVGGLKLFQGLMAFNLSRQRRSLAALRIGWTKTPRLK